MPLKSQLATGSEPYHEENLVIESTKDNDTDLPIWKSTRHSAGKWFCDHSANPGQQSSSTIQGWEQDSKGVSEGQPHLEQWLCHSVSPNPARPRGRAEFPTQLPQEASKAGTRSAFPEGFLFWANRELLGFKLNLGHLLDFISHLLLLSHLL